MKVLSGLRFYKVLSDEEYEIIRILNSITEEDSIYYNYIIDEEDKSHTVRKIKEIDLFDQYTPLIGPSCIVTVFKFKYDLHYGIMSDKTFIRTESNIYKDKIDIDDFPLIIDKEYSEKFIENIESKFINSIKSDLEFDFSFVVYINDTVKTLCDLLHPDGIIEEQTIDVIYRASIQNNNIALVHDDIIEEHQPIEPDTLSEIEYQIGCMIKTYDLYEYSYDIDLNKINMEYDIIQNKERTFILIYNKAEPMRYMINYDTDPDLKQVVDAMYGCLLG